MISYAVSHREKEHKSGLGKGSPGSARLIAFGHRKLGEDIDKKMRPYNPQL